MDLKRAVYPVLRTYSKGCKAGGYLIRAPPCFHGEESVDLKEKERADRKWLKKCVQPLEYRNRKRHWLVRRGPTDRWGINAYFSVA